ncbi:Oidioi.mRNA.OKI2018_I69.chr1.g2303.t1.cds [Oikopleura dioica]|uniref:glutaminase n=1 Tax=Oikopleura dioica TaxID=34765 RepID=A0ABN7SX21_OIKDI|nr:Oidioi.mRNA.OKI2018_I69.chr1.g2303.t1.cds [Oikopleura dioica]
MSEERQDILRNIFDLYVTKKGNLNVTKFVNGLEQMGLKKSDARLLPFMNRMRDFQLSPAKGEEVAPIMPDDFMNLIGDAEELIVKAFSGNLVIPDFSTFKQTVTEIYEELKDFNSGHPADYIPQLARVDPSLWAVSVCTVDGQRFDIGDIDQTYSIQSTSKPFNYAMALDLYGNEDVYNYVSAEPSGHGFNEIVLDGRNKPHNPMINAGAIMVSSLVKSEMNTADRFEYMQGIFRRLAGDLHVGFNNSIYLSERSVADREGSLKNTPISMQPIFDQLKLLAGTNLEKVLEFYFQLCSIEAKCDSHCVMAATLANGGICPITNDKVYEPRSVQQTLSLMLSCGMYDYSGQWAFQVGLPAKSGVSGSIIVVVPNVMAMCLYSPPLDKLGNSAKGIEFMNRLLQRFNFHHFDSLNHAVQKINPRNNMMKIEDSNRTSLFFAVGAGELGLVKKFFDSEYDFNAKDCNGRTVLHVASAVGAESIVRFLLEKTELKADEPDLWGETPMDIATKYGFNSITDILRCRVIAQTMPTVDDSPKSPAISEGDSGVVSSA